MFVDELNRDQQGFLLWLARRIISVDGNIADEETALYKGIEAQCASGTVEKEIDVADLPRVFETRRQRMSLLLELLGVAYADRRFHKFEHGLLAEVAKALDVGRDRLTHMESWVVRQFTLSEEAATFMEGN